MSSTRTAMTTEFATALKHQTSTKLYDCCLQVNYFSLSYTVSNLIKIDLTTSYIDIGPSFDAYCIRIHHPIDSCSSRLTLGKTYYLACLQCH